MKQKLQDLSTLLRSDRKTQVIAGLAVLAILFLIFSPGQQPPKKTAKKSEQKQSTPTTSQREVIDDVMLAVRRDLKTVQEQSAETARRIEEQAKRNADYEQRTAEIFKRILESMADSSARRATVDSMQAPNLPSYMPGSAMATAPGTGDSNIPSSPDYSIAPYPPAGDVNLSPMTSEPLEIETIGFEDKPMPPQQPAKQKVAFVGKGDSVRVKLLAGVNAPTDGTPYPVVFQLQGGVHGPDGSMLPLGEGRVVAAAQGSLTDSRVLFRLSSLNIRLPGGKHRVIDVDGWIVGEDGIRGMEGILIDPFGKAIGAAGIAGGLQGLGQAFADQQVTRQTNALGGISEIVTGNDGVYAAGKGLGSAADTWSRLIEKRANLMVPHVMALSGREGTAVFSKSFTIEGLMEDMEEDDNASMASLN